MEIINIARLNSPGSIAARFQGFQYGANFSFFVVDSPTGKGADKHRHPYEETFIILDGSIEAIVDGETRMIESGNIVIIPANT